LQSRHFLCQCGQDLLEQLSLQEHLFQIGSRHSVFQLLQFGRRKPFGIHQRLFANVLIGDTRRVGLGNFNVIPEHLIEPNLERFNPGPYPFMRFEPGDPSLSLPARFMEIIEA
jgi:hypothetical protein